ncbi:Tol-Pal system protein TolB [Candidatus Wolbachia massiliensis]|uniref:Tol-Pal system protein TolB n=1 Tax=Candidatus Wolbachia massiliensis TaxID=1845000 RepID=A0A7L7YRM1_9RICK|nr:Tol-Pal system protein TolB [Candidatus Wolbachia massiliensis]QOD37931.1 Tol-Pal system protein TolB [Candidatus Wolbachia massiliensis]
MKLLVRLILLLSLFIPYFTKAALYVDVRKNSVSNISLVVSQCACKTELESELSESITKIIETNLSNCGLFNVKRSAETESTSWTSDTLVKVSLSEVSDRALELSFHLFDTVTKRELFTQSVVFSAKDWRKIGHLISDAIHDRLIGEKGHFNTKIAYIAEEKDSDYKSIRKIAVMNQDGSNVKYLTDGDKLVSTPRFSPNGKSIVYISYLDGRSYIILKNLKDNTESIVSAFEGVISAPRFSPDGQSLLISHSSDGATNILSLDLNSKRTKKITKNSAISTSPSFSPDQKYIVFSSDISGSQQLYIIDLTKKSKKPKRISFGNGKYATPVWSPKGDLIAFTKIQSGKFYIGVMKPDGKEERLLSEGHKIESPAWLPNGRGIIFTKTESLSNSKLYLVDLVKKNQKMISTPTNAYLPDWSYF